MSRLKIETVVKPLPLCTQWSGKARTAHRAYDWYYSTDSGRIAVMANRPERSNFYWYLRSVPAAFKAEIRRAVAMQGGGA